MLATIGIAILFAFAGTLLAALWTFLIGFAGTPGARLGHALVPDENWHDEAGEIDVRGNVSLAGLIFRVIGQAYAALAFCALAVGFTGNLLMRRPDPVGWILWLAAFFISVLPSLFAAKDAARKTEKKTQDVAITFTLSIAAIGFWIFVAFPWLMRAGWGWLPLV